MVGIQEWFLIKSARTVVVEPYNSNISILTLETWQIFVKNKAFHLFAKKLQSENDYGTY